jgi:hypothetical protein
MKRRTVIAGLGSLAASGTFAVGSGAFTTVSAERTVVVETSADNDALLGLRQRGDGAGSSGGRSDEGGTPGEVYFNFPGSSRQVNDPDIGLGTDSVYEFDQDSGEAGNASSTRGLLRITNQGTQRVTVYSQFETDTELEIELYDVTDPDRTALRDDPVELAVGDHVDVGFRIRTFGATTDKFSETLTIVADQPDDE